VGASAGLSLRLDHFRFEIAPGRWWGPGSSPVELPGCWQGERPPPPPALEIIERSGCDLAPVDPRVRAGQLSLLSYVWPDDTSRRARLEGALAVARTVDAPIARMSASDYLRGLRPEAGSWLVVWNSVARQYFPPAEERAFVAQLDRLGAEAGPDAPFAHVQMEMAPGDDGIPRMLVTRATWPASGRGPERAEVLAEAAPHGIPTVWKRGA
jgi:hypothetical protein